LPKNLARRVPRNAAAIPALLIALPFLAQSTAFADPQDSGFHPGELLLATSTYQNAPNIVAGQTQLPPGCGGVGDPCGTAVADGNYPEVFNNDTVDGSFGVTSEITLDRLNPAGRTFATTPVPTDQMVTSFSSKSELALNLSPEGHYVSFMGYQAAPDTVDVSNANTPGVNPPGSNPTIPAYYRVIAQLGQDGKFHFTLTNAFSGDNGRAAITNDDPGGGVLYMAGNSADANASFIESTGAQIAAPSSEDESTQQPGAPTPVGSFSISQLPNTPADSSKDDNFRGLAIHGNVLYYSKGSGGKGLNSIYFVDTTGAACPAGVGRPAAGAQLPTTPLGDGSFHVVPPTGKKAILEPTNMCVLAGFPQVPNSANPNTMYPFGMYFASADVLYVADEGNGNGPTGNGDYSQAQPANNPTAGLQKWMFDHSANQWKLAYTLQSGLALGQPYPVKGLPAGNNDGPGGTGEPWAPATDGLRALTGHVNDDGTVTIYATTSTVSGNGDQGADANRLVQITDSLDAAQPGASESFRTLRTAPAGTVFRGISYAPGSVPPSSPGHRHASDTTGQAGYADMPKPS
jgi:hypothetical protein